MDSNSLSAAEIMTKLKLNHRPSFRRAKRYNEPVFPDKIKLKINLLYVVIFYNFVEVQQ
jgi:hypothetical protein